MAKFQRRHYEAIAKAFKDGKPKLAACDGPIHHNVRLVQWEISIGYMISMFLIDNANFSPSTFREACGLTASSSTTSVSLSGLPHEPVS